MVGEARLTIPNCGSIRCHARAPGEILNSVLGNDHGLQFLKQLLIERTEGNPFFLEESVRTMVETRVLAGERGQLSSGEKGGEHPSAGYGSSRAGRAH